MRPSWFHNGVACVQEEGGYEPGYRDPGYRDRGYRGYDSGYREDYGGPRYYQPPARNYYGDTVRPVRGRNGTISCSNPNYTWQDGACKPYRGA